MTLLLLLRLWIGQSRWLGRDSRDSVANAGSERRGQCRSILLSIRARRIHSQSLSKYLQRWPGSPGIPIATLTLKRIHRRRDGRSLIRLYQMRGTRNPKWYSDTSRS